MDAAPARSGLGMFAAATAFLLPVLYSPSVRSEFWTPKAALLLVVAAVGLVRLPRLVRMPAVRPPALLAVLFVALALVSAAGAERPALALLGLYNLGTGALFVASLAGAWAIGASLDVRGRRDVEAALLVALALNVAAAFAGLVFDLEFLSADPSNRSAGLLGNPVQLGAFLAAGVALLAPRFGRSPVVAGAGVLAVGASVQLAGSRLSLVVATLVALWVARRWKLAAGAAFVALLLAGFAFGGFLAGSAGRQSAASRASEAAAGGGGGSRLETWWSARRAVQERPLLGAGPGQFRSATSKYRTMKAALSEGPERLFSDAHNLMVEYGVTMGLLGLAALMAWLVLCLIRGSGPLMVFACGLLAHHLLQPQSVGTTPVMFLALGGAGVALIPPSAAARRPACTGAARAGAVVLAGAAATVLLVGDFHMEQARLDFTLGHALSADQLLPHLPETAVLVGRVKAYQSIVRRDPAKRAEAHEWMARGAGRDPTDPALWNDLADLELKGNDLTSAERHYRRALSHNPWSARALGGLGRARFFQGRYGEAVPFLERSHRLTGSKSIAALLDSARRESVGASQPPR